MSVKTAAGISLNQASEIGRSDPREPQAGVWIEMVSLILQQTGAGAL